MEKERFELIKKILEIQGNLDKYVILCEDNNGRYIKYAFQDGEPHDNRCLSWYDKIQPNALKRNGHDVEQWAKAHKRTIGKIYRLISFDCGNSDKKGDERCSPGCPKKNCSYNTHWTYDEPVKCACWFLEDVDFDELVFRLTIDDIEKLIK